MIDADTQPRWSLVIGPLGQILQYCLDSSAASQAIRLKVRKMAPNLVQRLYKHRETELAGCSDNGEAGIACMFLFCLAKQLFATGTPCVCCLWPLLTV